MKLPPQILLTGPQNSRMLSFKGSPVIIGTLRKRAVAAEAGDALSWEWWAKSHNWRREEYEADRGFQVLTLSRSVDLGSDLGGFPRLHLAVRAILTDLGHQELARQVKA